MRSLAPLVCLPALILAVLAGGAHAAPLRCRGAHDAVTRTVCDSAEYRAMDQEIGALVDRAKAQVSAGDRSLLADGQARFVTRRQGCDWASHNSAHPGAAIDECVRAAMEGRVRALRVLVERAGDAREATSR